MVGDTFLSLAFDEQSSNVVQTIGFFEAGDNRISVTYAYAPQELVGVTANGTYVAGVRRLSLYVYIPPLMQQIQLLDGVQQQPSKFWDGTWQGTTLFGNRGWCSTTGSFHNNFWRGVQTNCSPGASFSFGTFVGTFKATSTDTIAFSYGFVDIDGKGDNGLEGQTLNFDVAISAVGSLPKVVLTQSMSDVSTEMVRISSE